MSRQLVDHALSITCEWDPFFKNWHSPKFFKSREEDDKKLEIDKPYDAWVASKSKAKLSLGFTPTLLKKEDGTFSGLDIEIGGYFTTNGNDADKNDRCTGFYQDVVEVEIYHKENSYLNFKEKFVNLSGEENKTSTRTQSSSKHFNFNAGVLYPIPMGGISGGVNKGSSKTYKVKDFKITPGRPSSGYRGVSGNATMTQCYGGKNGITPFSYDYNSLDHSLHRYGSFPNSFLKPAPLAYGDLSLSIDCKFEKKEGAPNDFEFKFQVITKQRIISMGLWPMGRNHWFINDAKLTYECSIEITDGEIKSMECQPIFFTLGVERRLNTTWRGINYVEKKYSLSSKNSDGSTRELEYSEGPVKKGYCKVTSKKNNFKKDKMIKQDDLSSGKNKKNLVKKDLVKVAKTAQREYSDWYRGKPGISFFSWRHHHGKEGQDKAIRLVSEMKGEHDLKKVIEIFARHLSLERNLNNHSYDTYVLACFHCVFPTNFNMNWCGASVSWKKIEEWYEKVPLQKRKTLRLKLIREFVKLLKSDSTEEEILKAFRI